MPLHHFTGYLNLGSVRSQITARALESSCYYVATSRFSPRTRRFPPSGMNKAPGDCAKRTEPEQDGGAGLNPKAQPALVGGFCGAGHVKSAAEDPDQTKRSRDHIADVDRKQPERGQEDRQPFQRVHLHAKYPLEVGIAGYRRRLDAERGARLRHLRAGQEIKQDGQAGDECREVKHDAKSSLGSEGAELNSPSSPDIQSRYGCLQNRSALPNRESSFPSSSPHSAACTKSSAPELESQYPMWSGSCAP